jgi:transcriptional regulator with XRE-family HTH domain
MVNVYAESILVNRNLLEIPPVEFKMAGMGQSGTFGERVRAILQRIGMQQKELAFRADIPQSSLNRILTGATDDPQLATAFKIAAALGVSLDELAGDGVLPQSPMTPYDAHPEYRAIVDSLEEMDDADRRRVMEFIGWLSVALQSRSEVTTVTATPRDRTPYTERHVSGKTDAVAMPVQLQHRQRQIKQERGANPPHGPRQREASRQQQPRKK